MRIRDLSLALRSGELSPTEHVTDVLTRLRGDTTNSVVLLDEQRALADAAARTEELARGEWRGPLHGIAVGVKDIIDVGGLPSRCGSKVLADAPPAAADSAVVARLREAGAVVVGKLHTHEFAYGPTGDVSASGPARNPHDQTRITGGSSSGSAATVASGHLPLTLGTDTGCSVRTPAALCGVVGLKPHYEGLSTEGMFPLSESCDHVGLLTEDVHSASVAWDVLARADGTGGGIQPPGVSGLRIGVPTHAYWKAVDPAITESVAAAVAKLEQAGAQVVEVATPGIDMIEQVYYTIVNVEAYATHAIWLRQRPGDYQAVTFERLAPNDGITAKEYVEAQRARERMRRSLRKACAGVDALVLPTTKLRATPIGELKVDVDGRSVSVRPALLSLTLPFNLLGWPALSVPAPGMTGLPAGVQVVGVTLEERGILRVAAAIEG